MTTIQHTEPLNRVEADVVVRQLTGEFHNQYGVENGEVDPENSVFRDFTRKLSWQIGGNDTRDFRDYIVDALHAFEGLMDIYWGDQPHDRREAYEGSLNVAVNGALSAAGLGATGILRYGDQRNVSQLPVAA
ncbi:hypothetical protein ACIQXM_01825 [Arthrobacter sp. NPDC097144]|uniref:hypothetical protein n=1 Tax=Arthrobacter sp. NPDC097144 TaxID=3363946 RepID=UPI00381F54F8